jgi:hypothetical protein
MERVSVKTDDMEEFEKMHPVQSILSTFNSSFKSAFNLIAECTKNIHKSIEWSMKHQTQPND